MSHYEKADTVLWAFTPDGIVLHNFATLRFAELDGPGHLVWAYLDGTHSPAQVRERLLEEFPQRFSTPEAERFVDQTIRELLGGGFLQEHSNGSNDGASEEGSLQS